MLNFSAEGGHENLVTANARQQQQQGGEEPPSAEPSLWQRLWHRGRRGRTLAEQHGVVLAALSEPLLQAENGQVDNGTVTEGRVNEARPDPPASGSTERQ